MQRVSWPSAASAVKTSRLWRRLLTPPAWARSLDQTNQDRAVARRGDGMANPAGALKVGFAPVAAGIAHA